MLRVPFHQPDISEQEIGAVADVLRSGWLTTGPVTSRFEQAFSEAVGARNGVALNSCTAALHLALDAVGVGVGDEVIVPTMTFCAAAEVVEHCGATPVLVDIDPSDHNIDFECVQRVASPRTRAVIPVDFAGQPADLLPLLDWSHKKGIHVIEDAAHAFPASYQGLPVGSVSDVTCFSFYATKTVTCGEGGMATTERQDWAKRIRMKSLHGITRGAFAREGGSTPWIYDVEEPGWKYNLTDLAAALGLAQLSRSSVMWARRCKIASLYLEHFRGSDTIEPLMVKSDRTTSWHLFVIKLAIEKLTIDRDQFIRELARRGLGASVHFIPLHLQSHFRAVYRYCPEDFPVAYDAYQRSISLPIYSSMTDRQVMNVIDGVLETAGEFRR